MAPGPGGHGPGGPGGHGPGGFGGPGGGFGGPTSTAGGGNHVNFGQAAMTTWSPFRANPHPTGLAASEDDNEPPKKPTFLERIGDWFVDLFG